MDDGPIEGQLCPDSPKPTYVDALSTTFNRWSYDIKGRGFVKVFIGIGRVAFAAGPQE